jgi:hypothetical protein
MPVTMIPDIQFLKKKQKNFAVVRIPLYAYN